MNNVRADQVSSGKLGMIFKVCAGVLAVLVLLALASVIVAGFLMPQRYFSKVTMELPARVTADGSSPVSGGYDQAYVQTQFTILQRKEVLYPVIERLDLTKAYAPSGKAISQAQAYQRLRASMRLQEVRNTGLVEIGISDTDAKRAANIANAIAIVYQQRTIEMANAGEIPSPAEKDINDRRKRVEEASRLAMEIRARNGIADPDPDKESAVLSFAGKGAVPDDAPATPNTEATAAKKKMTEYVDAKRQAIRQRNSLELAELAYAQVKITEAKRPRAKIWEKAEIADHPENRIASLIESIRH